MSDISTGHFDCILITLEIGINATPLLPFPLNILSATILLLCRPSWFECGSTYLITGLHRIVIAWLWTD